LYILIAFIFERETGGDSEHIPASSSLKAFSWGVSPGADMTPTIFFLKERVEVYCQATVSVGQLRKEWRKK
jgi:hypothetical protein